MRDKIREGSPISSHIVDVKNVTKKFPQDRTYLDILVHPFQSSKVTALRGINLSIGKGEVVALVGPNGAGKTTLLKILCGLLTPDEGTVHINGLDVKKHMTEIKKIVGYAVTEERSFYWRLTCRQNLMFFAHLNNLFGNEARSKIEEVLDLLQLRAEAEIRFKDLSTGMKRRLAIARCLLTDSEILLLDEPTKSLDPFIAEKFRDFIREVVGGTEQKTVVMATHDVKEAEELCHKIAIINRGEIKYYGKFCELQELFNVRHRYVVEVLPPFEEVMEKLKGLPMISDVEVRSSRPFAQTIVLNITFCNDQPTASEVISLMEKVSVNVYSCAPVRASLADLISKIMGKEDDNVMA